MEMVARSFDFKGNNAFFADKLKNIDLMKLFQIKA